MLSAELVDEGKSVFVRNAAGLALKNALSARVRLHPIPVHLTSTRYMFSAPSQAPIPAKRRAMPPPDPLSARLAAPYYPTIHPSHTYFHPGKAPYGYFGRVAMIWEF